MVWQFRTGDFSYQDRSRTGRSSSDLAEPLLNLLREFPFASSKFLAGLLMTSKVTVSGDSVTICRCDDIQEDGGQDLIESQNAERMRPSGNLLESLRLHEDTEFKDLVTGDESWVYCICQETSMCTY
jgi:hypothetical protein